MRLQAVAMSVLLAFVTTCFAGFMSLAATHVKACTSHDVTVLKLKTAGASCSTARHIAATWTRRDSCVPAGDPGGPRRTRCRVAGYSCQAHLLYAEVSAVSCVHANRRVFFRHTY